jgi:chromate transporter
VYFVGRQLENPPHQKHLANCRHCERRFVAGSGYSLASDALTNYLTIAIAVATMLVMLLSEIDTLWIILGAAMASLCASFIGVV